MRKKLLYLLFFILLDLCGYSQRAALIIKPEFVGQHSPDGLLYLKTNVQNVSDTVYSFWLMRCSWGNGWTTDNDSITVVVPECDSNYPDLIHLDADEIITFYITLQCKPSISTYYRGFIKLGFAVIEKNEWHPREKLDEWKSLYRVAKSKIKTDDILWSDPIKVLGVGNWYIQNK